MGHDNRQYMLAGGMVCIAECLLRVCVCATGKPLWLGFVINYACCCAQQRWTVLVRGFEGNRQQRGASETCFFSRGYSQLLLFWFL